MRRTGPGNRQIGLRRTRVMSSRLVRHQQRPRGNPTAARPRCLSPAQRDLAPGRSAQAGPRHRNTLRSSRNADRGVPRTSAPSAISPPASTGLRVQEHGLVCVCQAAGRWRVPLAEGAGRGDAADCGATAALLEGPNGGTSIRCAERGFRPRQGDRDRVSQAAFRPCGGAAYVDWPCPSWRRRRTSF